MSTVLIFIRLRCRFKGPIPILSQSGRQHESGRPRKRDERAGVDRCWSRPTSSKQSRTKSKNFDMGFDEAVNIERRHGVIMRARRNFNDGALQAMKNNAAKGEKKKKTRTEVRCRGSLPHPICRWQFQHAHFIPIVGMGKRGAY